MGIKGRHMTQLEIISSGYRKNTIHIMSPNLPITFLTKLDLLENQNEVKDHRFLMDKKWSPPSKIPRKTPLNPPTYLPHIPILNLRKVYSKSKDHPKIRF